MNCHLCNKPLDLKVDNHSNIGLDGLGFPLLVHEKCFDEWEDRQIDELLNEYTFNII